MVHRHTSHRPQHLKDLQQEAQGIASLLKEEHEGGVVWAKVAPVYAGGAPSKLCQIQCEHLYQHSMVPAKFYINIIFYFNTNIIFYF